VTTLRIGIASYDEIKARTMAIARGELRPAPDAPKIWFPSIESLSRVLSDHNRALLRLIAEKKPQSLTELAALSGRAKPNLSRTVKTLARYDLVQLEKGHAGRIIPHVPYDDIHIDLSLTRANQAHPEAA